MNPVALATRKAQLLAEAERERQAVALAYRDVVYIINPPVDPARARKVHGFSAGVVRTLLPFLGYTRFGKLVRMLSVGLAAYRAVRRWR